MSTETRNLVEPTGITQGHNTQGQECIIVAHMPGGHRVTWDRDVNAGSMPKRAHGRRDAASARDWAEQMITWAQALKDAADWADAHADELNGPDGAEESR